MSDKENNISAVRLGDKLIIFLNGQRQVISKTMSPEIFDIVCGYIEKNDTQKITKKKHYVRNDMDVKKGIHKRTNVPYKNHKSFFKCPIIITGACFFNSSKGINSFCL
mgnify:CR=1 FL=1